MDIGENCFFVLNEMKINDDITFGEDKVFLNFTDSVDEVSSILNKEIKSRFNEDDMKNVFIPTIEDIYNSLFKDGSLCYVFGSGSEEEKIVFHVSKFCVINKIMGGLKMSFCQK